MNDNNVFEKLEQIYTLQEVSEKLGMALISLHHYRHSYQDRTDELHKLGTECRRKDRNCLIKNSASNIIVENPEID